MRALLFIFAPSSLLSAPVDFVRDVQPILQKSCAGCHGEKSQMASLRLDSRVAASKTIVAGKSAESALYQRVAGIGDQARMPMGGKPLSAVEIATIKRWIDEGAVWPDTAAGGDAPVKKH